MVLAEAICQSDGSVLLPEGFELGEVQLASLQKRGIVELSIAAPPTGEPSSPLEEHGMKAREDAVRADLRRLFRKSETDATTRALFLAVLEYRLEKIQ